LSDIFFINFCNGGNSNGRGFLVVSYVKAFIEIDISLWGPLCFGGDVKTLDDKEDGTIKCKT